LETYTDSEVLERPGFKIANPKTFYCWKRKGCPVEGCELVNDPLDSTKTHWKCAEPSQSSVNDPASMVTGVELSTPCIIEVAESPGE